MCARYTLTPEQAKDEPMPVDLPETFNYLIGLHVASRRVYESKGTHYLVYRGKVDSRETVILWRTTRGWKQEQFEADRDFVVKQKLTEGAEDRTYLYKAQRAAALIYAHFRKEFGLPYRR
jgi:hypothetical protein